MSDRAAADAARKAMTEAIEQLSFDVEETVATLQERFDEAVTAAELAEQRRCLAWFRTVGDPAAEVLAGIESFEEPPEATSPHAAPKKRART